MFVVVRPAIGPKFFTLARVPELWTRHGNFAAYARGRNGEYWIMPSEIAPTVVGVLSGVDLVR